MGVLFSSFIYHSIIPISIGVLALGCTSDPSGSPVPPLPVQDGGGGGVDAGADVSDPPVDPTFPGECDSIYSQDILPTFELEVAQSVWDALYNEWLHGYENEMMGEDPNPEHPLDSFKYENEVITNASIRLRGNTIWWLSQKKMQFEISFNTYDSNGRFHGMRHVLFDGSESNISYLRDRLGLAVLRDAGILAPCANNARIVVNGKYYGLYSNIEKVDKSFLKRNFKNNDGNLYKRSGSWELKTNEEMPDDTHLDGLLAAASANDLNALDTYLDLDQAVLEWAGEAVMPDNDGAWAGGYNFYIYDTPETGFVIIPWDLDSTFTRVPYDADPVTYLKPMDHGRPMYDITIGDPVWLAKYKQAVKLVHETAYKVDVLQARIDAWSEQIKTAALQDPNRPFTIEGHLQKVKDKREYVANRAAFVAEWLCYDAGGMDAGAGCVPP
jgi:hypothetical protein